ncbi:MAG: ABC transporter substrate-binding protein [Thaumarchaeota archaeon]|nr:ABC transporter substrate-binding protein [Nitrososphaerota archaeon]
MSNRKKAVSKAVLAAVVIIVVVLIVAGVAAYFMSVPQAKPTTITSVVTKTATVSGTPTTQVVTVTKTSVATSVATSTVSVTPTPTTTAKKRPDTLYFSALGAHWAQIMFGPDPHFDGPKCELIPLVYEMLFAFDPQALKNGKYKVIPWLAESYTVSEDGLVYTIKLRKGIKFHTGREMTADDVVYSIWRTALADWTPIAPYLVEPKQHFLGKAIKDVKKVDDYTVQIILSTPDPWLPEELTSTFFAIVDKQAMEEHTKKLADFNNHPDWGYTWLYKEAGDAGTGPYKVKEWRYMERYELERFDDYWGGPPDLNLPKPEFKYIVYIPVNEETDARLKLVKGDLFVVTDFLAETMDALKKTPGVDVYMGPYPFGMALWMHTVKGPLKDWRVRKAIKMAINYTAIEKLTHEGAYIAEGLFMAGMEGWEKNARYFPGAQYEEAKKLLDEAGYKVQSDGWRFHIKLLIRPAPRWGLDFTTLALQVKSDLAKIGIDAMPVVLHVSEYYAHVWKPEEEMMWIQPWDSRIPSSPIQMVQSWVAPNPLWWFGFNETTQPPEFITHLRDLYNKALKEPDPQKRIAILQELEAYWLEYGPHVNIANAKTHIGYREELKNFFWSTTGLFPSIFYLHWES